MISLRIFQVPQYILLPCIYSAILYWMTGLSETARQFLIFTFVNVCQSLNAISIGKAFKQFGLSTKTTAIFSSQIVFFDEAIALGYASGCVFGDEGLAITVMSAFMQALLVFGGFYINLHSVPMWMRPLSAHSLSSSTALKHCKSTNGRRWITYIKGCTGLLSHGNNTVYCPSETGLGLLHKRGMEGSLIVNMLLLIFFIFMYRVIGLVALVLRARLT
ncbi:hypothetical protein COOONC_24337 [Cooperia oncophora]